MYCQKSDSFFFIKLILLHNIYGLPTFNGGTSNCTQSMNELYRKILDVMDFFATLISQLLLILGWYCMKKYITNLSIFCKKVNNTLNMNYGNEYKMVIVIRNDLKLGKGKLISQSCHAALDVYKLAQESRPFIVNKWENFGCGKIALKVNSEKELLDTYKKAKNLDIPASLIQDAGHTQVDPGTITACAIGPGPIGEIDQVTRHLKLF